MQGRLISGLPEAEWNGAALDSRAVRGGELFFALPGKRTDGHRFVADALRRGASAAVVNRRVEVPAGSGLIQVDDPFLALHRLTREVRSRAPRRLIAITGSVGKTTTKEILATLLEARYRVARTPGNLNNLLGFPIALLAIPEDTDWMVAEMGMSTSGELRQISRLGRPDVAVFTNVRPAHLEFFGSLRAIAEAKAELLDGLARDGLVIANRDDREIARFLQSRGGRVVWFAMRSEADYRALDIQPVEGRAASRLRLVVADGDERELVLPLHGVYNVENFLAAAACAHALGVSLEEIAEAVEQVQGPPMRGVVHQTRGGILVVDDTYNSSPSALREALHSAAALGGKRHWAVLGDMLELGREGPELHRQAGRKAAELGFSPLIGVGELAQELVVAASGAGAETDWCRDAEAAAEAAIARRRAGDVILVKGSRGIGLEAVVAALLADSEEES